MASQNFGFLNGYDERLEPVAAQAELYVHQDPNLCLTWVRQFGEVAAQDENFRGWLRKAFRTDYALPGGAHDRRDR